jgi:hypothetical protein
MFSASLIVPLLLSMQVMAAQPRQQFSTCLRHFMDSKLEERMAADAFDTAIAGACSEQETAYRTAYIAAATRAGDSRASAERDANLEIADLRTNYKEIFHDSVAH